MYLYFTFLKQDDENDLDELREQLENHLHISTPYIMPGENQKRHKSEEFGKGRTQSNISTNSLDPHIRSGFMKKIMSKVTPNASPGNSDGEREGSDSIAQTPLTSKKRLKKSFKKRKQSPAPAKMEIHVDEGGLKERSYLCPGNIFVLI